MATKWKYATVPAEQRLQMLRQGNSEMYDEEIARTGEVIKGRLDAGLDVTEQMNWADTVSYNYNLSKANDMGISEENVEKTGYAQRLFASLLGEPEQPAESAKPAPPDASNEDYIKGVTNAYIGAVNSNLYALSKSYNDYVAKLNSDYNAQRQQLFEAYRESEKHYDEQLENSGHSASGGAAMTERLKRADMLYTALRDLDAKKKSAVTDATNKLNEQLAQLRSAATKGLWDEQYRYYGIMSDKEKTEYQKQRDAEKDNQWYMQFDHNADMDRKHFAIDAAKQRNDAYMDQQNYDFKVQQALQEYNMWLADQEHNTAKLGLDREKFEHQKEIDDVQIFGKYVPPVTNGVSPPANSAPYVPPVVTDSTYTGDTYSQLPPIGSPPPGENPTSSDKAPSDKASSGKSDSEDKGDDKSTDDEAGSPPTGEKIFGKKYVNYHNMVTNVMASGADVSREELIEWIDGFDLSEREKTKIKEHAGLLD